MKPIQALLWVKAINNSHHGHIGKQPTDAPASGSPPQRTPGAAAAGTIAPPSDPNLHNMSWTVQGHMGTGVVVEHNDTPLISIPKCFLLMAASQQCCTLMVISCKVPEGTGWWLTEPIGMDSAPGTLPISRTVPVLLHGLQLNASCTQPHHHNQQHSLAVAQMGSSPHVC
jgi:hypothetical protein